MFGFAHKGMLRVVIGVIIVSLDVSIASNCSLCFDGSAPGQPNATVFVPLINQEVSCGILDPLLRAQLSPSDQSCQLSQLVFSTPCGCPKLNITSPCPGVCLDRTFPSRPSRVLPLDLTGTGTYGITCVQAHVYAQQLSKNDSFCQLTSMFGQFCGCNNAPTSCTPCYGNTIMPDYTKRISVSGQEISCGNYALGQLTQSMKNGKFNSTTCTSLQSSGSALCDCPSPPATPNATCSLCNSNQTLLPKAIYNYSALNFSYSCGSIDSAISTVPASDCAAGKAIYRDVLTTCCLNSVNETSSAYTISNLIRGEALMLLLLVPWALLI